MNFPIRHPSLMAKEEPTTKPLYIGEWIDFRGKKDAEIVRACGINAGYLSELRAWDKDGKTPNPSLFMIQKLAKAIGVPAGWLHVEPTSLGVPSAVSRQEMAALGEIKDRVNKNEKRGRK